MIITIITTIPVFGNTKFLTSEYVDQLLNPYFGIQTSLAKDNLILAKTNASDMLDLLNAKINDDKELLLSAIQIALESTNNASDIQSARAAFLKLSENMNTLIENNRTMGTTNDIYKVFCPMAFDGNGGIWLQNNNEIQNPYYGAAMLRCGTVKNLLTGNIKDTHENNEHGSHHEHGSHNDNGDRHGKVIPDNARKVTIVARNFSFEPKSVKAQPGEKLIIELIRKQVWLEILRLF